MCSEIMILSDLFVIIGSWSLSDLIYPSGDVDLKDLDLKDRALSLGVPASVYARSWVCDGNCVCVGLAACK